MQLTFSNPPALVGENGHIRMSDGGTDWTVVVTREAMEIISSPPEASLERLTDYADVFARIAGNKQEFGRNSDRKRIWVMEEDVAIWLASERYRVNSWRRHLQVSNVDPSAALARQERKIQ